MLRIPGPPQRPTPVVCSLSSRRAAVGPYSGAGRSSAPAPSPPHPAAPVRSAPSTCFLWWRQLVGRQGLPGCLHHLLPLRLCQDSRSARCISPRHHSSRWDGDTGSRAGSCRSGPLRGPLRALWSGDSLGAVACSRAPCRGGQHAGPCHCRRVHCGVGTQPVAAWRVQERSRQAAHAWCTCKPMASPASLGTLEPWPGGQYLPDAVPFGQCAAWAQHGDRWAGGAAQGGRVC